MKQHSSPDEINQSLDLEKLSRTESTERCHCNCNGCRGRQYPRINERLSWECALQEIRARRAPIPGRNEFRGERTQPARCGRSMKSPLRDEVRIRAVTYKEGSVRLKFFITHPPIQPHIHYPLYIPHTVNDVLHTLHAHPRRLRCLSGNPERC